MSNNFSEINSNFNVDEFIKNVQRNIPQRRSFDNAQKSDVERIYLSYPGNYGRYYILPINNWMGTPFLPLYGTKEINVPFSYKKKDTGAVVVSDRWVKLLPKSAYVFKSADDTITSSLTAEESNLLDQAYQTFDTLYALVDAKNSREITKSFIRRKSYLLFSAYCTNFWSLTSGDARKSTRENFSGLFVCTSTDFWNKVKADMENVKVMKGSDDFIKQVYTSDLAGRTGGIMFNIKLKTDGGAGYDVSVNHVTDNKTLSEYTISEETATQLSDPVQLFLGSQVDPASNDQEIGHKRLFNAALIREAIAYMSSQIALIQAKINSGITTADAVKATTEMAIENLKNSMPATNDPMLADANANAQAQATIERIQENNTEFNTAPAAHVDPVTGSAAVNGGSNPALQFGGNGGSAEPAHTNNGGFGNSSFGFGNLPGSASGF